MKDPIKKISAVSDNINTAFDSVATKAAAVLGIRDPFLIMPYRGYGTPEWVYIKGRVLEKEGIQTLPEDAPKYKNVLNMYRRFESDEIASAKLKICVGDCQKIVETDEEGYFEATLRPEQPLSTAKLWHKVWLELVEPAPRKQSAVTAEGDAIIVTDKAKFGVISDIDDTVVYTAANSPLEMINIAYLGNSHSRKPFAGVDPFYSALQQGKSEEGNPIFYVSSSPWNMYDLFDKFMDINDIPNGPILLRDIELSPQNLLSFDHEGHKREQIDPILNSYGDLPFILFGDSGQKDPEIYAQLVQDYPDRILAVYIRDAVPDDEKRHDELAAISERICSTGVDFLLFSHTADAAEHAAKKGWILENAVTNVKTDDGI